MNKDEFFRDYISIQELEFPYLKWMSAQNEQRRVKIEQIFEYIKSGVQKDFIDLIEISDQFDKIDMEKEKEEFISKLPGVSFSYCHLENSTWPLYLSYTGLIAFEFRIEYLSDYDVLKDLMSTFNECTVLRFRNHFNGFTIVIDANDVIGTKRKVSFELINKFFADTFSFSAVESHNRIDHLTTLCYDPYVYFNPNAIGFMKMISKWSRFGLKARGL